MGYGKTLINEWHNLTRRMLLAKEEKRGIKLNQLEGGGGGLHWSNYQFDSQICGNPMFLQKNHNTVKKIYSWPLFLLPYDFTSCCIQFFFYLNFIYLHAHILYSPSSFHSNDLAFLILLWVSGSPDEPALLHLPSTKSASVTPVAIGIITSKNKDSWQTDEKQLWKELSSHSRKL